MRNFIEKSKNYPYWWRNIGTGYPRTWWRNLIYYSVGGGGFYRNRKNLIYKLNFWLK